MLGSRTGIGPGAAIFGRLQPRYLSLANNAPTLSDPGDFSGVVGSTIGMPGVVVSDVEGDNQSIEVIAGVGLITNLDPTFSGTLTEVNQILATLQAVGQVAGDSTVTIRATDSGGTAELVIDVALEAVTPGENVGPLITAPDFGTLTEGTGLVVAASVTDPDIGTSPLRVQINMLSGPGNVVLAGSDGLTFIDGNASTLPMNFTGDIFAVNQALRAFVFQTVDGDAGTSVLSIEVDDQGATGTGGPLFDIHAVTFTVEDRPTEPVDPPQQEDRPLAHPDMVWRIPQHAVLSTDGLVKAASERRVGAMQFSQKLSHREVLSPDEASSIVVTPSGSSDDLMVSIAAWDNTAVRLYLTGGEPAREYSSREKIITVEAHPYSNGDRVRFDIPDEDIQNDLNPGSIDPDGIDTFATYFVVDATPDTFSIALTRQSEALNVGLGYGVVMREYTVTLDLTTSDGQSVRGVGLIKVLGTQAYSGPADPDAGESSNPVPAVEAYVNTTTLTLAVSGRGYVVQDTHVVQLPAVGQLGDPIQTIRLQPANGDWNTLNYKISTFGNETITGIPFQADAEELTLNDVPGQGYWRLSL